MSQPCCACAPYSHRSVVALRQIDELATDGDSHDLGCGCRHTCHPADLAGRLHQGELGESADSHCRLTDEWIPSQTKMQVLPAANPTIRAAVRLLWNERGFRGFFSGSILRISRKAASSAIAWSVYEGLLLVMRDRQIA